MARNIIQALEGIAFPTDRSRLVDYARRHNLTARSLSALEAMPQRNYASMADVLAALPSKSQMRRQMTQESRSDQPGEEVPLESAMERWEDLAPPPADPFGWQQMAVEWTRNYLEFWQRFWTGRSR
jgi:hypothetical protein